MGKFGKIAILASVVILFVFLLYYFGGKEKKREYVTDDWEETYDPTDKGPYGTYMLKELLDTTGLFGSFLQINTKVEEQLEDNEGVNDIYFFVGKENYLTEETSLFLMDFVDAGNTVFMMCDAFPYWFLEEFTIDPDSAYDTREVFDSMQTFTFSHATLSDTRYKSKFIYNNEGSERLWTFFDTTTFDFFEDDTLIIAGTNLQNQPNFLKINYGAGKVFLHSTPYLFTNISLMKKDGFDYAEKVLKHIPPGRVQWDRYNLVSHYLDDYMGDGSGGMEERQSILQFILANPALAWAMVLLMIGAFLYAVFKGKRMQRVIPATESKENTSLGYINTLSSLYLQENKHHKLIRLKEKTFLNFIADHYYIITKEADEKFIAKVAIKSQVERERIEEIFKLFRQLEKFENVSDDQLILLHQKIEYFYKKCR